MTAISIACFMFSWISLITGSFMPFEDCGSVHDLVSIEISSCTTYPCRIQTGSSVNVTTTVLVQQAAFNSAKLVQNVYFVVNSIVLKANVTPDLCSAIHATSLEECVFYKGERLSFQTMITVQNLPPLRATLWWVTQGPNNQVELCYKISVILT